MMKVQKIRINHDTQDFWIVLDSDFLPIPQIDSYLKYLHSVGKSPNTIRSYAYHLKEFWLFLGSMDYEWNQVTLSEMSQFINFLKRGSVDNVVPLYQSESKRTAKTINAIVTAVSSFYDYSSRLSDSKDPNVKKLVKGKKASYKPFLHHISKSEASTQNVLKLKEPKRLPEILTTKKVKQLSGACKSLRDKLLVLMLYETGMRIGECLGLRHEDIKSWDKTIHIVPRGDNANAARAKSNERRVVDISSDLIKLYTDYVVNEFDDIDSDYVFINIWGADVGKPLAYSTVYTKFKRLSKKLDIPFTPHIFRHTHATELLRSGWDASYVQKRLGHKDIQTTINTYAHLNEKDLKEAFSKFKQETSGVE
ncbi:tyrosine-type recombinase/integrase [Vreelandella rituensis]|nr:tyrosine-type recombinase/integrase [Halomonas rituensis]